MNFAEIQVSLKHPEGRIAGAAERARIVTELRRELQDYPGVTLNFSQPIQNSFDELLSGTRAYFALKLYGENLDVLREKAEEIRKAIAAVPAWWTSPSSELRPAPVADRTPARRDGPPGGDRPRSDAVD